MLCIAQAKGFALDGSSWPSDSTVVMQLELGPTGVILQDGLGTWDNSAADALSQWNLNLDLVQFSWVLGSTAPKGSPDGFNSVFYSNTVFGDDFGSDTLAVTVWWTTDNYPLTKTEADVVFNTAQKFNSYRGPLQTNLYDFHRTALHEFGHVLGLAHVENYPPGQAIMEPVISNLDHLAPDDLAGVEYLYGFRILTSGPFYQEVGVSFSLQITTNGHPTSYSASGLPPGLTLNATTGLISGIPNTVGAFTATLTAHHPSGDSSVAATFNITPRVINSGSPPGVVVGDEFSYQITADNNPTSFSASGLPAGLQLDPQTGLITGIPTVVGQFNVTITAHGDFGDATATVVIFVIGPLIDSYLYPISDIGSPFSYQIMANNHPTNFTASGPLPPGVEFDPKTGTFSGIPTLSGPWSVSITATGPIGTATDTLVIGILPLPTPPKTDIPLATAAISSIQNVADPSRPRLYASTYDQIVVLETPSLATVAAIPAPPGLDGIPGVNDMSLSIDRSKLWIAPSGKKAISSLDLTTLKILPDIATTVEPVQVREGLDGRFYVTGLVDGVGGVFQINGATGVTEAHFTPAPPGYEVLACTIELSPDRRTLYVGILGSESQPVASYDVSSATPTLLKTISVDRGVMSLAVSHDGAQFFCCPYANPYALPFPVFAGGDLTKLLGQFQCDSGPSQLIFSADDALAFAAPASGPTVEVFDTKTFARVQSITPPGEYSGGLAVDNTNQYLIVNSGGNDIANGIKIFLIHPPAPSAPHALLNVSTRTHVEGGDNVEIGGFIITGGNPKTVVLRAIAPSLSAAGVSGAMADPLLELHDATGALVIGDDNWNATRQEVIESGLAPLDEHEATIVTTLAPGAYTAVLSGVGQSSGVALVELFDLAPRNSIVANISTRGKIETEDNVMIGGFIIGGSLDTRILVRAIGPSLAGSGVSAPLQDPVLELHGGNGELISENDNWRSTQQDEIIATSLAPSDDRESAILATLQPGSYTAIVRGQNNSTGVGLVEIYNLDSTTQ